MKLLPLVLISLSVLMVAACGDFGNAASPQSNADMNAVDYPSSSTSSVIPDLTENLLKDSRDGQSYKTVTIGSQTWMAQNLNYEAANSYCFGNTLSNCTKYGRLYTWAAAKKSCPSDWHLPTKADFETLFTTVGGKSTAGTKLKSTSGWYKSGNGTDAYSFSALPAGDRDGDGNFGGEGYYAGFWSSTEDFSNFACYMYLDYDYDGADLNYYDENDGFSVRCVKD